MQFTQDLIGGVNLVRGYSPGELRINDTISRQPLIVGPQYILLLDDIRAVNELSAKHAALLKSQQPEVVLIGSGTRQVFPPSVFFSEFSGGQFGIEIMNTPAACRTYNVLVTERRAAIALLIPT